MKGAIENLDFFSYCVAQETKTWGTSKVSNLMLFNQIFIFGKAWNKTFSLSKDNLMYSYSMYNVNTKNSRDTGNPSLIILYRIFSLYFTTQKVEDTA